MKVIGIDASRANLTLKTGTEWYSYFLIQKLKDIIPENYQVILYAKEPLCHGLEILPKNWQEKVLAWPPKLLWTQIRLSLAMLNFWSRPDLLFIPAHTMPFIHPQKTMVVVHDVGFEKMRQLYGTKELDYHRLAMRFVVKHADKIITVSKFSQQEINKFFNIPIQNIAVVYNGFANNVYQPLKDKNNEKIKKYHLELPYLLYIGRLEQKKNIPRLIKAFSILKKKYQIPHRLILVGLPGFKYGEIKTNIDHYKLTNDVIELGYVEQTDINYIMNSADLFVFPSLYEGFGIPILEAMSAGTPVVCSNIPALKEIGESAAEYFNPNDELAMAKMIYKVLEDKSRQAKMKNLGFQQISKFSYDKCAQETWQIIKKSL